MSAKVLMPDFALVQDGTRQDEAFRQAQHRWYLRELQERGISYTAIAGDLGERQRLLSCAFPPWMGPDLHKG